MTLFTAARRCRSVFRAEFGWESLQRTTAENVRHGFLFGFCLGVSQGVVVVIAVIAVWTYESPYAKSTLFLYFLGITLAMIVVTGFMLVKLERPGDPRLHDIDSHAGGGAPTRAPKAPSA